MKPDYSNNHSGNSSIIIYLPPNVNIRTREARAPTMLIKTGGVIDVKSQDDNSMVKHKGLSYKYKCSALHGYVRTTKE